MDKKNTDLKNHKEANSNRQEQKKAIDEQYEHLKASTDELFEMGKEKYFETHDKMKEYTDEIVDKIKKKPLTSVLIAGGIGFILSSIFKKRS